jgi:regulator of sigma E protease
MDAIITPILNTVHTILYYFLPFVAVLGIMIFFHELGHFLVAKLFGVKVLKFALGFGPKLVGKTVAETEYSIRYFPLGGFVKMLGEDPKEEAESDVSAADQKRAFNHQHVLKRMAIVAAGPVFNLLLALFLFCGLYLFSGVHVLPPEIGQVTKGSPAHKAGLAKGDLIVSVQGHSIERWSQIRDLVRNKAGVPLSFVVKRNDRLLSMTITPEAAMVKNEFGEEIRSSLIGIVASGKLKKLELGPGRAITEGLRETWKWIKLTFLVIGKLFQGVVSIKTVGGPILIGQMAGKIAQENVGYLVPFMGIISVNLGILNLFPIPILDGGVIIFLLIELLTGKPLSIRKRELAQRVGLAILVLLMVIVTYNDLSRFKFFQALFG